MEVKPSTYYTWQKTPLDVQSNKTRHPDALLPEEREAVLAYAMKNPNLRHRELTWKMVDENIAFLSVSSVYKILKSADLVCSWQPKEKRIKGQRLLPLRPDERWQSDLSYIDINGRKYYLITFIDEYSRYIMHHELMSSMDANSISIAAE